MGRYNIGPHFWKNPLDVFEPVWDGTAFSIDPYVDRAIRDHVIKGFDMVTDCGDQFPKISPSGSPKENQSFVEFARIFSVVLEPGWQQRIDDAQVLDQSLEPYKAFAKSPQSDDFEYRTLEHSKLLYRKSKVQHQLVIPAAGGFRELLLQELHASKLKVHLGIRNTVQALLARVQWPGMMKTVKDFVNSC